MKRFAVASLAVLAIGVFGLSACGGGEKVKELEGQVQTLTTKNAELEAKGADMQKQLDECKAAAMATPEASPMETGKPGATKVPVKTPAKATPTATVAATPTPIPSVPKDVKLKLKIK